MWIRPLAGRSSALMLDSTKPVVRFGTSFTKSKESRFSSLAAGNPKNTGLYNSDGVNVLAADTCVKWRGFAVNGQYFFRWLNNFRADGPIPISETFDHGFEVVASQFIVPKKWEVYGRTSFVFSQFRNSYEYAPGVKWYPLKSHRVYVVAEGLRIVKTPVTSIVTPYDSGFTGWSPMLQLMFNF
jgi:hypothetical protein